MQTRRMLEMALPLLEEAQRHTANNIANVDTPDFTPTQVDFPASMRAAIRGTGAGAGLHLARTDAAHLSAPSGGIPGAIVQPSQQADARTDGNRVDLDYELTQLARNPYTTLAELLKHQNRLVRDVLRAR